MVLGITVDLSALPYWLHLFLGPHRAGVLGRLVLVGSDCASRRRAVSRGSVHPRSELEAVFGQAFRSERQAGVGSERHSSLGRPSGWRLDHPSGLSLGFWAGPGVARRSQRRLLGRAFARKQVHEGPWVYEPDRSPRAPGRFG